MRGPSLSAMNLASLELRAAVGGDAPAEHVGGVCVPTLAWGAMPSRTFLQSPEDEASLAAMPPLTQALVRHTRLLNARQIARTLWQIARNLPGYPEGVTHEVVLEAIRAFVEASGLSRAQRQTGAAAGPESGSGGAAGADASRAALAGHVTERGGEGARAPEEGASEREGVEEEAAGLRGEGVDVVRVLWAVRQMQMGARDPVFDDVFAIASRHFAKMPFQVLADVAGMWEGSGYVPGDDDLSAAVEGMAAAVARSDGVTLRSCAKAVRAMARLGHCPSGEWWSAVEGAAVRKIKDGSAEVETLAGILRGASAGACRTSSAWWLRLGTACGWAGRK